MKERPILFSAPMVRAILEGRKTQTRRVIKWPIKSDSDGSKRRLLAESDAPLLREILRGPFRHPHTRFCPYGQPGERLWVRETWKPIFENDTGFCGVTFLAGGFPNPKDAPEAGAYLDGRDRWRPSIHMPRLASRITLEIVAVRIERLQDISEADALAEGCPEWSEDEKLKDRYPACAPGLPRHWYSQLWDKINGPGSWVANPWVWVVEFKRIEGGGGK